ncbi:protein-tyrosine phosphatase [Tribonema minus]|uniref:protein-tyrosine-phosphatase n=1 Tax=Tribonema minus TaxID=303371 RepID=A0A835YIK6_9STRA|nr:protein-tyrosine phosphatase [Tribonema minus]
MFFPPVNFAPVEEGLYRSGLPTEINYPFLERLKLKTIIYLFPDEDIDAQLESFLEDQEVKLVCLGEQDESAQLANKSRNNHMIAEETVIEALSYLVDTTHYPLLVMCGTGKHRTGTVVACLRKLQRWNLSSIFEEYRHFTKHKVRVQNEQFIELFDTDLVRIPPRPPRFLVAG